MSLTTILAFFENLGGLSLGQTMQAGVQMPNNFRSDCFVLRVHFCFSNRSLRHLDVCTMWQALQANKPFHSLRIDRDDTRRKGNFLHLRRGQSGKIHIVNKNDNDTKVFNNNPQIVPDCMEERIPNFCVKQGLLLTFLATQHFYKIEEEALKKEGNVPPLQAYLTQQRKLDAFCVSKISGQNYLSTKTPGSILLG